MHIWTLLCIVDGCGFVSSTVNPLDCVNVCTQWCSFWISQTGILFMKGYMYIVMNCIGFPLPFGELLLIKPLHKLKHLSYTANKPYIIQSCKSIGRVFSYTQKSNQKVRKIIAMPMLHKFVFRFISCSIFRWSLDVDMQTERTRDPIVELIPKNLMQFIFPLLHCNCDSEHGNIRHK